MRPTLLIILFVCTMCSGKSQHEPYKDFVNSFKEVDDNRILKFADLAYSGKAMTKEEAAKFVYNNDSSRLYCESDIFNMEEEKVLGRVREMYLPSKCLKVEKSNYIILGYSSFECSSEDNFIFYLMHLLTIDKSYNVIDSLTVYKENEYNSFVEGLFNVRKSTIYLRGETSDGLALKAELIHINNNGMFDVVEKQIPFSIKSVDLKKQLEDLDWVELFE